MAEVKRYFPGTFCWVELETTDMLAANRFYGELFGWRRSFVPLGGNNYYNLLQLDGKDVGAVREIHDEAIAAATTTTTSWRLHVATDKVDKSVQRALELGATLLSAATDISNVGRVALLQDPTGAVFALWEARDHIGIELSQQAGTLSWQELSTSDVETARSFYANLFGWQTQTRAAGARAYTTFKMPRNAQATGGIQPLPEALTKTGSHWMAYFAVEDFDKSLHKAQRLGAALHATPAEMPSVGRYAVLQDPQGALFSLVRPAQEVEQAWMWQAAA